MVFITAVHLAGGYRHEHITDHMWLDPADGKSGTSSTESMIKFLDEDGGVVKVAGPDGPVTVGTVHPKVGKPHLRSYADGEWSDNLLSLPRY